MTKRDKDELAAIKRVLKLVDGYVSTLPQDVLHGWDGGMMTWQELRVHLQAAINLKVLNP